MSSLDWKHMGFLQAPIFDEVTHFDAPILPKWITDAFLKKIQHPGMLMEYAQQDAVLAKDVWQAPIVTYSTQQDAVIVEVPETVYDKAGSPHLLNKQMWLTAPMAGEPNHVLEQIKAAVAQYLPPKEAEANNQAKTVLQYWNFVRPLINGPHFYNGDAAFDRKLVQWDHDLAVDGEILAAGQYKWWTGKYQKFAGLGFFAFQHGGPMTGFIPAKHIKTKWSGAHTEMHFHYHQAIAQNLLQ